MNTIAVVARREITERLGSRTTWVTIGITALLVVALIVVPGLLQRPPQPIAIGLVGPEAQAMSATIRGSAAAAGAPVALVDVPSEGAARDGLMRGSLAVALLATGAVEVKQDLPANARTILEAALNQAHQRQVLGGAGVAPSTVDAALRPVGLVVRPLQPPATDEAARTVTAFAVAFLLYIALAIYGAAVSMGVAQEKTSRTAEVLLAAVPADQLLAGKVSGIGITGLVHLGIAVAAGLLANLVVHDAQIPATVWLLLPSTLLWFLLGYALYALVYAAAGAMVARPEDVNTVSTPITLALVMAWLLTYAVVLAPDTWWATVASFVPFFAPMLMPARMALGPVPGWQVALDLALMLAALWLMVRLAARIYARALMHSGERLSWRAAARL